MTNIGPSKAAVVSDLLGWGGILTWLGASAWAAIEGNTDVFQRLGSFGVAVAVFYFAIVRMNQGVLARPGYHEKNRLMNDRLNHLARNVEQSYRNTSLLAAAIAREQKASRQHVNRVIGVLAKPVLDRVPPSPEQAERFWAELEERAAEIEQQSLSAEQMVGRSMKSAEVLQIATLVIATLQWGFGDLLLTMEMAH